MNGKTNVGIIFGGKSGEHEVSLNSAYNVIKAIDRSKFDVTMIGISKDGAWKHFFGDPEMIGNGKWEYDTDHINENLSIFHDEIIKKTDIFFPVLHGTFGEDGTIQGLFEMIDKPYVGCGVLASSAAMDKAVAKVLFRSQGIPVAEDLLVYKSEMPDHLDEIIEAAHDQFDFPMFVKPVNMGSSVGISKAHDKTELKNALLFASKFDNKILIEKFIDACEVEVGVLGNEQPVASCIGQIIPCHEFYDYEAKYLSGHDSKIIIPAPVSKELTDKIIEYALRAYRCLGCSGLSRIDFFVNEQTQKIILNEVNTLPGFTNISMYSKLWEASGIPYTELITRLIGLGFERYHQKKELLYQID
ncbi:MAG: D-alanine--D-alanine ligase family protein [Anaerofustis sp.]